MTGFAFNRVAIVESLDEADPHKSGTELHAYLDAYVNDNNIPSHIELYPCASANEFEALLKRFAREAALGDTPIVHIECHGDEKTGLHFSNGSELGWNRLTTALVELNRATRFNLLVVLAACFGAQFLKHQITLKQPAPFWGFVGPSETTNSSELIRNFRDFYRDLLSGLNLNTSFSTLRLARLDEGQFLARPAESLFLMGFEHFVTQHCTPAAFEARVLSAYQKRMQTAPALPLEEVRQRMRAAHRHVLERFADSYFMTKDFPENMDRFASTIAHMQLRFSDTLANM